jgi:hypothetical protein
MKTSPAMTPRTLLHARGETQPPFRAGGDALQASQHACPDVLDPSHGVLSHIHLYDEYGSNWRPK